MKPVITYHDDSNIFQQIEGELRRRLPLTNLTFNLRGLKTIPKVDFTLQKFTSDLFPRSMPVNTNISPFFLHIYLVNCDDSDHYKNILKKQLSDWIAFINSKKNQEYLICYVATPDTKKSTARFLNIGGSVYDKIKSDFNQKVNKCAYIKSYGQDRESSDAWVDFIEKISESVLASFTSQIISLEEDTRRLDSQRLLPGWNYCQYFILKEGLAFAYEFMGLYDDALLQYDELNAQFYQSLEGFFL